MISSHAIILYKAEATYGTDQIDADLDAGTAVTARLANADTAITPTSGTFTPDRIRPSQDGVKSAVWKQGAEVTLSVPFTAPSTGLVLPCDDLLRGMGVIASVPGSYRISTVPQDGVTVWKMYRKLITDGWRLRKTTGVLFNGTLVAEIGSEPVLTATGLGIGYADLKSPAQYFSANTPRKMILESDGTTAANSDFAYEQPERMLCAGVQIQYSFGGNTYNIALQSATIDLVWAINLVENINTNPTANRVVRTRPGVSNATVNMTTAPTLTDAEIDQIQACVESEQLVDLTFRFESATKYVTVGAKVQFLPELVESDSNGILQFEINGILAGDLALDPLGDNSFWINVTAKP